MTKNQKQEIITAVAYYRFSSHRQNEQSIEGQRRDCEAYAARHNIKIIREYIDRAFSAKSDARPEFQRMIKDSAVVDFNAVLVWKLDRFARNRYDSAHYKARLKKNGAKIISVMEPISDTPEGILMESLLEGMAEYYSADLAQKMRRGLRESARKGKLLGKAPYGYKRDKDGMCIINDEEASTVKLIFKLYVEEGYGNSEILRYLSEHGLKNSKDKPFTRSSICKMLSNIRYTGLYKYENIEIPGGIPAIIDEEIFYKAQRMKNVNRTTLRRHINTRYFPLTGKLYCGCCGTMMNGISGVSRNGNVYYYYQCPTHRKKSSDCCTTNIRADKLEDYILDSLHRTVMTDENISALSSRLYNLQNEMRNNDLINTLEHQLKKCKNSIANIMTAIESGIISTSLSSRLQELEDQAVDIKYSLEQEKAKMPDVSKEQIEFMLFNLRENFCSANYENRLLDTFVNRIFYTKDKLIIWLNYTKFNPGPNNPDKKELETLFSECFQDGSINAQLEPPKKGICKGVFFWWLEGVRFEQDGVLPQKTVRWTVF